MSLYSEQITAIHDRALLHLDVNLILLIAPCEIIVNLTGGTSMGDHSGGGKPSQTVTNEPQRTSLTERAGAGLLMVVFVTLILWHVVVYDC